jgi:hypothetical protein
MTRNNRYAAMECQRCRIVDDTLTNVERWLDVSQLR